MDKQRLSYSDALAIAQSVIDDLAPYCERIEIAGSLRRKKETIGDLEICVIPKYTITLDMFGVPYDKTSLLDKPLEAYEILKGGDKYKQIELGNINLDLFITNAAAWGMIYTIRTGSADFSHWLVTSKQKGGALPSNMAVKDGRLWIGSTAIDAPEEGDIFKAIGLPWIAPEQRTEGHWHVNAWGK